MTDAKHAYDKQIQAAAAVYQQAIAAAAAARDNAREAAELVYQMATDAAARAYDIGRGDAARAYEAVLAAAQDDGPAAAEPCRQTDACLCPDCMARKYA